MTLFDPTTLPGLSGQAQGQRLSEFEDSLLRVLNSLNLNLEAILNRGLNFTENFDARILSYTSNASPDTEDTVAHSLGRAPSYFVVISKDKAGDFYKSGTAWTSSNIYLKCSVASVAASILVF